MNNIISRLVCAREFSELLIASGVIPWAHMWHIWDGEQWTIDAAVGGEEYEKGVLVPAYTKEELDVMLGPDMHVPTVPHPRTMGRLQDPTTHVWFGPAVRFDFARGADCTARVLVYWIHEMKAMKAADVNRRFIDVFALEVEIEGLEISPRRPRL